MTSTGLVVVFQRPSGQIGVVVWTIYNPQVLKHIQPADLQSKSYPDVIAILAEKEGLVPTMNHQGMGDTVTYTFLPG